MIDTSRPLLALGAAQIGTRTKAKKRDLPRLATPAHGRQTERLSPRFASLAAAIANQTLHISPTADEVDPELVLVFDLAGTVDSFCNAVAKVDGLEFLAEYLADDIEPDDDFALRSDGEVVEKPVRHSVQAVFSNTRAASDLVRMFELWKEDGDFKFDRGLGRFSAVFRQLLDIRRWSVEDRIAESGLLEDWHDTLAAVGPYVSPILVEIELWYRARDKDRSAAEQRLRELVAKTGGEVRATAQIHEIRYHALLVELPKQQVAAVVTDGAESLTLLAADEIMFMGPYAPMAVAPPSDVSRAEGRIAPLPAGDAKPRVALLDGLPFANHDLLRGRLIVDDPDDLSEAYSVASRHHGTSMASMIIHGDLSRAEDPSDRPLYVRPIMRPHPLQTNQEVVDDGWLFPDLLHRAIRRIVEGEMGREAAAPSVRVVNLSIGMETRAFVRRMSPAGRLLDWLAVRYNLLFVVSAGNHVRIPLRLPSAVIDDVDAARAAALDWSRTTARLRGILPPGDALNALTVGATHADASPVDDPGDTVWDLASQGAPALYGAVGPGVGRSIKPELRHEGGRGLYVRPVATGGAQDQALHLARTAATGPGIKAAAVSGGGVTNATAFTFGTSNATALVTRHADRLFELLEKGRSNADDLAFPDAEFHPVLVKALLAHSASWGDFQQTFATGLELDSKTKRKVLTDLLGYGNLEATRLGVASANRAVLLGAGRIGRDQAHVFDVPLPPSLRSKAEWHRFTVTLAYMAPTAGELSRYRSTKVFFEKLEERLSGARSEAEYRAVRRGTLQHEIFEGRAAMTFGEASSLPISVQCQDDARRLKAQESVRFGLVVSVETSAETSLTIHDEIRDGLRAQARLAARDRVRT